MGLFSRTPVYFQNPLAQMRCFITIFEGYLINRLSLFIPRMHVWNIYTRFHHVNNILVSLSFMRRSIQTLLRKQRCMQSKFVRLATSVSIRIQIFLKPDCSC